MRAIWAVGIIWFSLAAMAEGQAYQAGLYDGRSVPGWTYSEAGTQSANLPTWYPTDGSQTRDGANCNVGTAAVSGTAAQWNEYFASVTPQSFVQQLRANGTDATQGYLTEIVTLNGRPAMRNLLAVNAGDQQMEFMILSISGADQLVTVTCTALSGQLLPRLTQFYSFAEGLTVYTAAPR
ncbi:MAG: hypothetical protein NXI03_03680 [Alphaproteobacteria bacterium]|uniref:hypothetical protein n=1 Tax=Maricaulis alexandrii TaxID=2570354 RepID=UPI0011081058|nr:hypothetical protein [Maricaulis alexandrii]MCR9266647.1 hypothetical protein [Alphaproteobacteria bacterium]